MFKVTYTRSYLRSSTKPSPKIKITQYLATILEQHHENETPLWLKEVELMVLEECIFFSSAKVGVEVWGEDQTHKTSSE